MDYVVLVFPEAHIDAHVAAAAAEFDYPGIRVQHVGTGTKAWELLPPAPILMMRPMVAAGEKRLREARFLSALLALNDPVVLPSMDHLVSALRQLACAFHPRHSQPTMIVSMGPPRPSAGSWRCPQRGWLHEWKKT